MLGSEEVCRLGPTHATILLASRTNALEAVQLSEKPSLGMVPDRDWHLEFRFLASWSSRLA